jgi:hypothetical protein
MPNLPISQLSSITESNLGYLSPTGEFAVAQDGVTYKVRTNQLTPYPQVFGLFSQTGDSVTVSGTTSETTILGSGIGTLSVPANGFSVGDSFQAIMGGVLNNTNDDLTIRLKTGSVILAESSAFDPAAAGDYFFMNVYFTVRAIGAAGVASISTLGNFQVVKTSNGSVFGEAFQTLNNTTFDTTNSNTLDITVQFSSSNPLNFIYTDLFVLNKIF